MDESYLSWLRLVPGVSADLARGIVERYPDPELLKGATPRDLAAIPGMDEDVATRVLELVRTASTSDASWYRDEPALYLCPECGSFVGKGSSACPFCGVVFDEEGSAPAPASPVEELLASRNGEAKICTRCGAFLEPGATSCRMCGTEYAAERFSQLPAVDTTPIPEEELSLCPSCGAFLAGGAAHCVICGKPIADERIREIARNGKGVSKDFLTRWQKAAVEGAPTIAPAPVAPRTLVDELRDGEKVLDAQPALEQGWVHRGRVLVNLGLATEAIACFDRAGTINPANDAEYRKEAIAALGPGANLSILPQRWIPETEALRPAPEPRGPPRTPRARGASRGFTNGRVNGLTNGRRGRTNGRVNGLTNGSGATNGLVSGLALGEGRTNGLVNGNGFTNGGRAPPQRMVPSAGREWTRSLAGVAGVVLLMILAPILASMLTTPPPVAGIAIDGSFGDWAKVPVRYADPIGDASGNPDIDLVSYQVAQQPRGLSIYARVNGVAFQGAAGGTDVLVALIDADRRADTGYDAGRTGAEYAVEIIGWDSLIRDAPLAQFQSGPNRTDWLGFASTGLAKPPASGSRIEL